MAETKREPHQQFEAVEELLTRWLKERRALLGQYTEIALVSRGRPGQGEIDQQQREFCGLLVDYVSSGHFEVYLELLEEAETFADGSDALASTLMPAIGDTTEFILAYEEKYAGNAADSATLPRDMVTLGEVLETRFALEDQLIARLHNSHRRQQG